MGALAESYGFEVVNDFSGAAGNTTTVGLLGRRPLRADYLDDCDIIIGDVNFFRGGDPESGVIFDLGFGFARKKRLYTFTRDRRDMVHKYPFATFGEKGELIDPLGFNYLEAFTVGNLMYVVPSKLVEGTFEDCLKTVVMDLIEDSKDKGQRVIPKQDRRDVVTWSPQGTHRAYLAGFECFMRNAVETGEQMKALCKKYHFEGIFPPDTAPGVPELGAPGAGPPDDELKKDRYAFAANIFDRDQQHIRNSNMIIANLNPFHGQESDSGTVFELGMCYGLGYDCYGFIGDGRPLIERIPCVKGADGLYRDIEGYLVEDRGFPLNQVIMDGAKIIIGDFEAAARFAAIDIGVCSAGSGGVT
ncbi:hypothetical protein AGMMS49546_36910 [Spirochaetia bacterium]|nr:hypothetical protein AGMMS49546_36910 [Spirochaetia bacterium]